MTPPLLFLASSTGAAAVLSPVRRGRKKTRGAPPRKPPGDAGGGGGGDWNADGPAGEAASGGSGGVGPFALVVALGGITTLFIVLIAVWLLLRRPAPDWRAAGAPDALHALWLSTACLAASSAAVELAARRARGGRERRRATLGWLVGSLILGLSFLAAQVRLWISLAGAGLVPAASGYAAVFFALTGLHAVHVLGGLGFLAFLTTWFVRDPQWAGGAPSVRLGAVYWHYMGGIWLVLFALLYFVR